MPLRAFIDSEEVIAPALDDAAWDALRETVAARGATITLPCCGAEGFMRRSALGTAHFAHKRGGQTCETAGETVEHLKAKADIIAACRAAGYHAAPEVAGDDWRADVLATRGAARIAFEVQWSFLHLERCEYRQERYARDGVRGCWFFRKPPPQLARGDDLRARRELPLFHLLGSADGSFTVRLHGVAHPLAAFVVALLGGRVRFCEHATAAPTQTVRAACYPARCARCGRESDVYAVEGRYATRCGVTFRADADRDALAFHPDVLAALAAYRRGAGAHLRVRVAPDANGRSAFQCATCGAALPDAAVREAFTRYAARDAVDTFEARIAVGEKRARYAHWCYPPHGEYCG